MFNCKDCGDFKIYNDCCVEPTQQNSEEGTINITLVSNENTFGNFPDSISLGLSENNSGFFDIPVADAQFIPGQILLEFQGWNRKYGNEAKISSITVGLTKANYSAPIDEETGTTTVRVISLNKTFGGITTSPPPPFLQTSGDYISVTSTICIDGDCQPITIVLSFGNTDCDFIENPDEVIAPVDLIPNSLTCFIGDLEAAIIDGNEENILYNVVNCFEIQPPPPD